jgi:hypothetical protein
MPPRCARSRPRTAPRCTASHEALDHPVRPQPNEYAYLEGAPEGGPTIDSQTSWDIDGLEFRAREDFGAAAIEWRGLVKTPS